MSKEVSNNSTTRDAVVKILSDSLLFEQATNQVFACLKFFSPVHSLTTDDIYHGYTTALDVLDITDGVLRSYLSNVYNEHAEKCDGTNYGDLANIIYLEWLHSIKEYYVSSSKNVA